MRCLSQKRNARRPTASVRKRVVGERATSASTSETSGNGLMRSVLVYGCSSALQVLVSACAHAKVVRFFSKSILAGLYRCDWALSPPFAYSNHTQSHFCFRFRHSSFLLDSDASFLPNRRRTTLPDSTNHGTFFSTLPNRPNGPWMTCYPTHDGD